jgi:hypothetical protein
MLCEFRWNKKKKLPARMHGVESFKIIDAQQAKLIESCRNTKYKLLKTGTTKYAETVN